MADLERRHLASLTFPEVSRALRALSSAYVERRAKLGEGRALSGAGKRAAFALFYGPLHYLLVREIVRELDAAARPPSTLIDLGCGTGASGVAWAAACGRPPRVVAIDRNAWALGEAAAAYRHFGVAVRTRQGDAARAPLPEERAAVIAAFAMNELADDDRDRLLTHLTERASRGDTLLIVEPLAKGAARWWGRWQETIVAAGGRADEWRCRVPLPPIVAKLDRAAGLDHRELTGRSLLLR